MNYHMSLTYNYFSYNKRQFLDASKGLVIIDSMFLMVVQVILLLWISINRLFVYCITVNTFYCACMALCSGKVAE